MSEIVNVTVLAHFTDTRIGSVSRKQQLKLPILLAEELESIGLVQIENPQKTVSENVLIEPLADGMEKLSASLPVDQASPSEIATSLEQQGGEQSQSMTVGNEQDSQMFSMPVTGNGGNTTTEGSQENLTENSGRKTGGRKKLST